VGAVADQTHAAVEASSARWIDSSTARDGADRADLERVRVTHPFRPPDMISSSGAQVPVEEMTPTTSQGRLRRCEAGWEGSRRRSRDPRNTWATAAVSVVTCAYEAVRFGRAGRLRRSPWSSKGRCVDAVGAR